ncbi:PREDICTED: uncharacterized protein LOC105967024 [Erythranthe guttata]|uniref:uncharacterized protein LOC105967024 n=1 Tax=Erythranthe guttata TaxID=4155 RepID=UPI00064E0E7F|nr:PREDICTED: uncharacterized protein LOC105967024 [Erythranthe guttata]|eukprot:XP_012847042.1 PREDICTED: uncharacterized protein LOC105967024 [Erythranthe guttata]
MADWSQLPYDLVHEVASHLVAVEDFLAFSAVCCDWRSVYSAKEWHQRPQVPLLMIFVPEKNGFRNFISLYRNKVCKLEIPEFRGRKSWGSCSGWILTLGLDLTIQLLNPLTRVCPSLPPISSLQHRPNDVRTPYCYRVIKRVFVFMKQQPPPRNDEGGGSFVVIIYGPLYRLALYRPGYTSWTIPSSFDFDDPTPPENVKFALRKGKFNHLMLVESRGDILTVYTQQDSNRCGFPVGSVHFFVYALDFINKQWVEVRDLGNRSIFVDKSGCVVVCGPERFNCRSNSVYFVADNMQKMAGWGGLDRFVRV